MPPSAELPKLHGSSRAVKLPAAGTSRSGDSTAELKLRRPRGSLSRVYHNCARAPNLCPVDNTLAMSSRQEQLAVTSNAADRDSPDAAAASPED